MALDSEISCGDPGSEEHHQRGYSTSSPRHLHGLQTERGYCDFFPSVSVCSPVCHKVRSAGAAIRASDFRLCMSTVCSGMTLICLQLISPGMHACVHVGECMCVCIHGRMFTYLSSQQHPHNQLILLHFWKQLPFSFLRVDQWRVLFR